MGVVIWRALPSDGSALTRVAQAAKRHWKYPEDGLRRWRDALTVTPGFVARHSVCCAIRGASMLGFYALSGAGATRELEHLWVLPAHIGRGVGARLLDHAVALLKAEGARVLRIASDPNAERLYLAMGAHRVCEVASTPLGRTLPLLVIVVSGR